MKRSGSSWSQIFTVILALLIIFFSFKIVQEILNRRSLNKQLSGLNHQITDLQGQQQQLQQLITYLQSLDFVEKEARSRLNLRKDGEHVIIIPEGSSTTQPAMAPDLNASSISTTTIDNLANWQRWWQYIFPNKKSIDN